MFVVVKGMNIPGPEVIKLFFMLNSAEHEFVLLIHLKSLTVANSYY